jgi:hypothetical protein
VPGQEWGEAIIDGISGARLFVLILSGNANASPQVRREVERAVGHNLPIIPFRIEDVQPARSLEYFISSRHWLDALTPPLERHLDQLADTVVRLLGAPAAVSPAAGPAAPAPARKPAAWRSWAVALVLAAMIAGAGVLWWQRAASPAGPAVASDGNVAAGRDAVHPPARPAAPALPPPALPAVALVDLGAVSMANADDGMIDAEDLLHDGAVRTDIRRLSPPESRLVVLAADARFPGLLMPGTSPRQLALIVNRRGGAAFTLRFARPLAELEFRLPGLSLRPPGQNYARPGHIAFPGFTATALDQYDRPVGRVDRARIAGEIPAQSLTLRDPARGIRAVRFEMDDVAEIDSGYAPEAGAPPPTRFIALLIDAIRIRPAAAGEGR